MALPRAVIYCRCSTEEESQADALRNQVSESEACVRDQGWLLADRYVELKSGTTTKGRAEYNRLFEDLLSDKFDIIVIKSQDRLMRNVKDWYLFLDRMLSRKKRLFMYIERKFYTTDDALITGIKAILAEEYSRELSKKINNAHRYRQRNGGKAMLTSRTFGFLKGPDGSLGIVEDEAEAVRKIYEYSAAGYGSRAIANIFLNQGYVKRTGNALTAATVGRIIRNPLYKGTMVMNKMHYDFETKMTVKVPREQWICREGAVPAIVDQELWERANQAMTERSSRFHGSGTSPKGSGAGRHELSGKIVCGRCKKTYYRTWRRGWADRESMVIEWKCSSYLEKGRRRGGRRNGGEAAKELGGGCDGIHLNEKIVLDILEQISGTYGVFRKQDKPGIVDRIIEILGRALSGTPAEREREKIEREERKLEGQKDFLLTKLLEGVISDEDYQRRNDELEHEIHSLRAQKGRLMHDGRGRENLEQRMEKIRNWLENGGIERAAAAGTLQDVKEIRVHEWQLEICFEPRQATDFSGDNDESSERLPESGPKGAAIWVDYPFGPETVRGRYLDRRRIVRLLEKNPAATARKLADEMERSPYMVRNRMEELTAGGFIRFNGRGGHGTWEVLRRLPPKEESIRAGGL